MKPNITSIARLLAYVTGLVNQELLLKNEYLLAENRIPYGPETQTCTRSNGINKLRVSLN